VYLYVISYMFERVCVRACLGVCVCASSPAISRECVDVLHHRFLGNMGQGLSVV